MRKYFITLTVLFFFFNFDSQAQQAVIEIGSAPYMLANVAESAINTYNQLMQLYESTQIQYEQLKNQIESLKGLDWTNFNKYYTTNADALLGVYYSAYDKVMSLSRKNIDVFGFEMSVLDLTRPPTDNIYKAFLDTVYNNNKGKTAVVNALSQVGLRNISRFIKETYNENDLRNKYLDQEFYKQKYIEDMKYYEEKRQMIKNLADSHSSIGLYEVTAYEISNINKNLNDLGAILMAQGSQIVESIKSMEEERKRNEESDDYRKAVEALNNELEYNYYKNVIMTTETVEPLILPGLNYYDFSYTE